MHNNVRFLQIYLLIFSIKTAHGPFFYSRLASQPESNLPGDMLCSIDHALYLSIILSFYLIEIGLTTLLLLYTGSGKSAVG